MTIEEMEKKSHLKTMKSRILYIPGACFGLLEFFLLFSTSISLHGQMVEHFAGSKDGFSSNRIEDFWLVGKDSIILKQGFPNEPSVFTQRSLHYYGRSDNIQNPFSNPWVLVWRRQDGSKWAATQVLAGKADQVYGISNGGVSKISSAPFILYNRFNSIGLQSIKEENWYLGLQANDSLVWFAGDSGMRLVNLESFTTQKYDSDSVRRRFGMPTQVVLGPEDVWYQRGFRYWFQKKGDSFFPVSNSALGVSESAIIKNIYFPSQGDTLLLVHQSNAARGMLFNRTAGNTAPLSWQFPLVDSNITALALEPNGFIFISEDGKLARITNNQFYEYPPLLDLPEQNISHLKIDNLGRKIIGTLDSGLYVVYDGKAKIKSNHKPIEPICDSLAFEGLFNSELIPSSAIRKWLWNMGDGTQKEGRAISHLYTKTGKFTVTLTIQDSAHHEYYAFDTISVISGPKISLYPSGGPIQSCKPVLLSAIASGPVTWELPDQQKLEQYVIWAQKAGTYKARTELLGCVVSEEITIQASSVEVPVIRLTIQGDDFNELDSYFFPVGLKARLEDQGAFCFTQWTLAAKTISGEPTATFSIEQAGLYWIKVEIENSEGCKSSDSLKFEMKEGYLPNLVTANQDGKNDFFVLPKGKSGSDLVIYNRWGMEVYSTNSYQNNWPGSDVQSGTYFYRIKVDEQTFSGWVEVVK